MYPQACLSPSWGLTWLSSSMSGPPGRVAGWDADGDSRPDECTWVHMELVLNCPPFHTEWPPTAATRPEAAGAASAGGQSPRERAGQRPRHRGSGRLGRWGVWLGGQRGQWGSLRLPGFISEPRDTGRTRTGGKLGSKDTTCYVPDARDSDAQSCRLMPGESPARS